jgi:hypothetical protein
MISGGNPLKTIDQIDAHALKEHLLKNWMTHDAVWFLQVFQTYGIETANRLNKSAIQALAGFEIQRARQLLGLNQTPITAFAELRMFIDGAFRLSTGDFMGFVYHWPEENVLHWEFKGGNCFAYKGMRRLGVADRYECGVLYRVQAWLDHIGVRHETSPKIEGCLQHSMGICAGDMRIFFT